MRKLNLQSLDQEKYNRLGSLLLNGWFITSGNVMFERSLGQCKSWGPGLIVHLKDGVPHRSDGPAMYWKDDFGKLTQVGYLIEGKFHREDGPSFIRYKNPFEWNGKDYVSPEQNEIYEYNHRINDVFHSLDGPAKFHIFERTQKEYYIDGLKFLQKEFFKNPRVILRKQSVEVKNKMKESFSEG